MLVMVVVLLTAPTSLGAQPARTLKFVAPYTSFVPAKGGKSIEGWSNPSGAGCSSSPGAWQLRKPIFYTAEGRLEMGSSSATTSCNGTNPKGTIEMTSTLEMSTPTFRVPAVGSYWITATWRLSILDNLSANANGTATSLIWINVQLYDLNTLTLSRVGWNGKNMPYVNATSESGCCGRTANYTGIRVPFFGRFYLNSTDSYRIRIEISESSTAHSAASSGAASATTELGLTGPSTLKSITIS